MHRGGGVYRFERIYAKGIRGGFLGTGFLAVLLCTLSLRAAQTTSAAIAQAAVGSTSQPSTLTVTLPGALAGVQVNLHYGTEFKLVSASCFPSTSTTTCSAIVAFAPQHPGLRQDGLIIQDSSRTVLADRFSACAGHRVPIGFLPCHGDCSKFLLVATASQSGRNRRGPDRVSVCCRCRTRDGTPV